MASRFGLPLSVRTDADVTRSLSADDYAMLNYLLGVVSGSAGLAVGFDDGENIPHAVVEIKGDRFAIVTGRLRPILGGSCRADASGRRALFRCEMRPLVIFARLALSQGGAVMLLPRHVRARLQALAKVTLPPEGQQQQQQQQQRDFSEDFKRQLRELRAEIEAIRE